MKHTISSSTKPDEKAKGTTEAVINDTNSTNTSSMDESPLVGYGTTEQEAIHVLNNALYFHYGSKLVRCDQGRGLHFVDRSNKTWHLASQHSNGLYKIYLI
jgi:hypothetical protein